ncbi:MAG: hypothetical protein ASARMPREDX12_005003 [Alectoria sarmentosa]|nr:MAG: hypothetical protein ASARMPRED_003624 [Alectoria sarmentosa]CAD6572204.1 MAG: hypothetical protein ASARMPREDX12_005003 [Alectoria sarmentosa]
MLPSSDQASSQQQPAVEIGSFYQEEASRRPSPGRKGQGKSWKKNENGGENAERSPKGFSQELTSPPSILSQLHASMPPPPALSNGVSSPRLEAWDAPTRPPDVPTQNTSEWARNVPYGRSPPQEYSNGVSRAGSPPEYRPPLDPELRGGFSHTSPPNSPRAAYRQPIQRTNEYQSFGDYMGSSPPNRRPLSMHSQNSHYPPPPHHQQAHYYTAPEIDFGNPKLAPEDRVPGEGFCCVFDSLSPSGHEESGNTENVLLVGFDRGVNIYHIGKKRFDSVGRLDGLRGSVIGAKILHSQSISDRPLQPLLAVIVHGPCILSGASTRPRSSHAEVEEFEPSRSEMQALQAAAITHYQTTVEIYSLRKGQHIGTLFRTPKVEIKVARLHTTMPPPVGDLSIQARGKFFVISSGISGEVFIFERSSHGIAEKLPGFRCLGKVWTRTGSQKTRSVSTSSSESGPARLHDALATNFRRSNTAILSLSNRWLAVAPPSSSGQTTLHGETEPDTSGHKAPGISSHAPTAEPQISCDLDNPEGEGLLNKAARDIAQGFLKTAQWVGLEGKQAWSNYWSKPSEQNQQGPAAPPPNVDLSLPLNQQSFPPTHAQDNTVNRAKNQPALVSIFDLEKLSKSQHSKGVLTLQPLATFSLPTGCSLLSFSPNGLYLLTASAKGDVEHVWDLMRMVHGEAVRVGDPNACPKGPSVRQIAKITRMTEARIVDVVWTEPKGERLAIITDRGTVHINDLPPSAFSWPPSRRILRSTTAASISSATGVKNDDIARPVSAGAGNGFSSAFGIFSGKTQPLIDAVRGRRPSIGSNFSGFGGMALTAGIGTKSGRAVAAGFNRSVGAAAAGTVNTIRHLGENRLALPSSQSAVVPGCVRWLSGKGLGRIAITGGGIVRIYSIRQSSNSKGRPRRPSVFGDRPVEFSLPNEPAPIQHITSNQHPNTRSTPEPSTPRGSFWLPQSPLTTSSTSKLETHPLSYAELDTSLAYQPFHTDRRVNLYVYSDEVTSADPTNSPGTSTWVFGEPIPATQISVGSTGHEDDDADLEQVRPSRMENVISMKGNVEEGQQIVVTTRRKRSTKDEMGAEDEIFEDDCEILEFAEERV